MPMAAKPPSAPTVLRFTLEGQMPSGKGMIKTAVIRGRMMKYPNPRFKAWRKDAHAQLAAQRGEWVKLEGPATVSVRYYKGDLKKRDVPGIMDALCHLLEWCPNCKSRKTKKACPIPVVADDSLLDGWSWPSAVLDREWPRIEVEIRPAQI